MSDIWIYVIKSVKKKFRYVGITADLDDRLERHNHKRSLSTKSFAPFELVYTERYSDYARARDREKFLKSGAGRSFLDQFVN